jgi:hypothetical protein
MSSAHGPAEQSMPQQAHVEFEEKEEEEEMPQLSLSMTIGLLVVVTVVRYDIVARYVTDTSAAGGLHRGMASGFHRRPDFIRTYQQRIRWNNFTTDSWQRSRYKFGKYLAK